MAKAYVEQVAFQKINYSKSNCFVLFILQFIYHFHRANCNKIQLVINGALNTFEC